jgi:hypothetical protein
MYSTRLYSEHDRIEGRCRYAVLVLSVVFVTLLCA